MKIDFVHIGIHKTASTFLQKKVFPEILGLQVVNLDFDMYFYDNFIKKSSHRFNSESFLLEIENKLNSERAESNILAISDENLSGDIYSGRSSKELMLRIKECFGDVKILIVLRNQVDYILSAYSNYVLHGGSKTINCWIFEQETLFGEIFEKMHYSYMVKDYIELFGRDNVTVVLYEKMFESEGGLSTFFQRFDLSFDIRTADKVNVGRSLFANHVFAILNLFRIYKIQGIQRIFRLFPSGCSDRKKVKALLLNYHESFNQDNSKLSSLLEISLPEVYFF